MRVRDGALKSLEALKPLEAFPQDVFSNERGGGKEEKDHKKNFLEAEMKSHQDPHQWG